jgi:cell wall-associated NlpC family hydrolase
MTDFSKYIGIPFKHMGRDFCGVDCFGLCKLILTNEANIDFGDYLEKLEYSFDWYKSENHIINNIPKYWYYVNAPFKKYDVLLFYTRSYSIANHMGLYIEDGKFIHIDINNTSRIDRLEGFWDKKLYKVLRYKEMK